MYTIATDECEAAEASLRRAESQVGEIRHLLHSNGMALGDSGITLFGEGYTSDDESLSKDYKSPTPDNDDHAI